MKAFICPTTNVCSSSENQFQFLNGIYFFKRFSVWSWKTAWQNTCKDICKNEQIFTKALAQKYACQSLITCYPSLLINFSNLYLHVLLHVCITVNARDFCFFLAAVHFFSKVNINLYFEMFWITAVNCPWFLKTLLVLFSNFIAMHGMRFLYLATTRAVCG